MPRVYRKAPAPAAVASYTDAQAQDAVGGILLDSATIDFTYTSHTSISGAVLDSPKLNGQAASFYLDRANHTGTQLAATISDFSGAVIALLTDANLPDNLTLTNITQITNRAHANLQSLGADDHAQYALLAGRAGGQILTGGTGTSDNLTLKASTTIPSTAATPQLIRDHSAFVGAAAPGQVATVDQLNASTWANILTVQGVGTGQTITPSGAGAALRVVNVNPALVHTLATTGTPYLLFQFASAISIQGAGGGGASTVNLGNITLVNHAPTVSLTSENAFGSITTNASAGVRPFTDAAVYNRGGGITGATATIDAHSTVHSAVTVDAGITATTLRALRAVRPSGTGTITTLAAVDIGDLQGFGGTLTNRAIGVRSVAPILVGDTAIGADSMSTQTLTNLSVGIELQSTTKALLVSRMTGAQAAALTPVNGMLIYVTDNVTAPFNVGVAAGAWYGYDAGAWVRK